MSTLVAYDLRTESRTEPLGLDAGHPRFSWRLRSETAGQAQSAYRIDVQVADRPVWSSGWVADPRVYGVAYLGPLQPRTRYHWTLQLRDVAGEETEVATSWFETGLVHPAGAGGVWIGRNRFADSGDPGFDPPTDDDRSAKVRHIPPAAHLRTTFTCPSPVVSARLYATARGIYTAHLNGHRVGDHELAPGWTDYTDRILYQTFDVTDLLQTGSNALGLLLTDGWWSGYVGFDSRRQGNHYGNEPSAWALLVAEHPDGSSTLVSTDGSWRESRGAVEYTDLLMGEYVDARHDVAGWTEPGYDDTGWVPVAVTGDDLGLLVGQVDEPIRATQQVPAVNSFVDAAGRTVYDFGQNLVGRVAVELGPMPSGAKVVLRHGEILTDTGTAGVTLYTENLRTAEAQDVYVSAGASTNRFEPTFTLHGFRYLELTGDVPAPPVSAVTAVVLHNDTPRAGRLVTSSPDVNQLLSNIEWGQRGNFVAVPTDCPQRDERLGWMADAQVFLPTAAYLTDVSSFFTRWLRDVRYAQSPEGSFPDVAPVVSTFFADGAPAWADGGVIMPWHLYRVYGDERLLADSYPSMRRWVDFVERHNPSLVWTSRVGSQYGDWLQVDAATPRPVLATAYFAQSAALLARTAEVLDPSAAERYRQLAQRVRETFCAAFVAPDGRIEGDTQTVYLLALAFDLVPDDLRTAVADHLVRTLEEHDGLLTTGFVGVSLLCPVLSEIGRDDLAFALLETDRYPSWLYSVRHGATTIWERWDGWTEHDGFQAAEMNSFNHYSLGSVGEWLYRYVAGLDQAPDSLAFARLRFAPRLGGSLTEVSASYESAYGTITSRWTRTGGDAVVELSTPPGVRAEVTLPAAQALVVDGHRHQGDPGESFEVGSGRHRFELTGLPA